MTKRAVILAGGGIRVAWQAGVVQALDEAGLRFDHGDGTSGGIFTLGMLLSGVTPAELGERWRRLQVWRFTALQPLRSYLRPPTDWAAFGGAGGVRDYVLPHLGIDIDRIRSATGMTGTFNVARFDTKECVPIPNDEIDLDRLVAGVSLAGLMPAVEAQGATWTDAVWIQDANLLEAVRRGCNELWVAWCIANTPRWGRGGLEQYVHMIELSAVSSLNGELAQIADINRRRVAGEEVLGSTEPIVVHVVKPAHPLPLDPDFVAGRIDAETLVAMGYRDACRYLGARTEAGIPLDGRATAMAEPPLGARTTLRFADRHGAVTGTVVLEMTDLAGLRADPTAPVPAVGGFTHPALGYRPFHSATASWRPGAGGGPVLRISARLGTDAEMALGVDFELPSMSRRGGGAVRAAWSIGPSEPSQPSAGLATTAVPVDGGTAVLRGRDLVKVLLSFEPAGAHDLRDRARCLSMALGAIGGAWRARATAGPRSGGAAVDLRAAPVTPEGRP